MTTEPLLVALDVIGILDRLSIPYALGGSVVSSIFGEPRSSVDADMLIALDDARVGALISALQGSYYVSEEAARDAVRRKASFNVIHLNELVKVDLFVMGDGVLDREQMRRRVRVPVTAQPERLAYATSAEDIILRKLDWFRGGGGVSDRQWRDVLGVLKEQKDRLDFAYLVRTAEAAGLAGLLTRARSDAGGEI